MLPRMRSGAISDRYSGAVNEAMPTANPRIKREITSTSRFWATAQPIEPTTNKTAPNNKLFLRPKWEDIGPLLRAPSAAPNIMMLTTISCCWLERLNSFARNGNAPAITPISRPNSKPANAARKQTCRVWRFVFAGIDDLFITTPFNSMRYIYFYTSIGNVAVGK
ncbi:hypothetical protein D3C71_1334410 [compost metagenome]